MEQPTAIDDDPLETFITMRAYLAEVGRIHTRVDEYWVMVAEGSMSIALAGCLTNFAFTQIRHLSHVAETHEELLKKVSEFDKKSERPMGGLLLYPDDPNPNWHKLVSLAWPLIILNSIRESRDYENDEFLAPSKAVHLHNCFASPDAEIKAGEQAVRAMFDCPSDAPIATLHLDHKIKQDYTEAKLGFWNNMPGLSAGFDAVRGLVRLQHAKELRRRNMFLRPLGSSSQILTRLPLEELFSSVLFQSKITIPLYTEIESYLFEGCTLESSAVFGLNMLVDTLKKFLWSRGGETPNKDSCRKKALRLAQDVRSSIDNILAAYMGKFTDDQMTIEDFYGPDAHDFRLQLDEFLADSRCDLYYQCPWVAGSQISSLLGYAQLCGSFTLGFIHAVDPCLQMYNMLRQTGVIDSIDILEELCLMFLDEFSNGNLPEDNFYVNYLWCLGGKFTFKDRHTSVVFNGAEPESQHNRIRPDMRSLFVNQYRTGNIGDEILWKKLLGSKNTVGRNKMRYRDIRDQLFGTNSSDDILYAVERHLLQEFEGNLPFATTNFFKVNVLCIYMMAAVHRKCFVTSGMPREFILYDKRAPYGSSTGIFPAMEIFDYAAQDVTWRLKDSKLSKTLKYHSGLEVIKDAMLEVCKGKSIKDFLWEGV